MKNSTQYSFIIRNLTKSAKTSQIWSQNHLTKNKIITNRNTTLHVAWYNEILRGMIETDSRKKTLPSR